MSKSQSGRTALGLWMLAASAQGFGCATDTLEAVQDEAGGAASVGTVREALVYSLSLGRDHQLEFWEYPGHVLVTQETSVVGGDEITSRLGLNGLTFEKAYRTALPNAKQVPQVLIDADTRHADAERAILTANLPAIEATPDADRPTELVDALPTAALAAGAACSPDVYGDNWGSEWFRTRYCPLSSPGYCRLNFPDYAVSPTSDKFKWSVMAADFDIGADARASYQYWDCAPRPNVPPGQCFQFSYTIANTGISPRQVKSWTVSGGFERKASGTGRNPCKRIHAGVVLL
jgi:hypothetical protein